MGDLLKNIRFIIAIVLLIIAFSAGYIVGDIANSNNKETDKEKSAYELIQEGLERIENE